MNRPTCEVIKKNEITGEEIECGNLAHIVRYNKNGTPVYRRFRNYKDEKKYICGECHKSRYPKMKYNENERRGRGYRNSKKDYCENKDGMLGFKCTANIVDSCMLTVDHFDGNKNNNNPENLKTFCCNCHSLKTKIFRDSGVKKNHVIILVPSLEI